MKRIDRRIVRELAELFHRNGYIRMYDAERRAAEGSDYKKGDEVRLVAESKKELIHMRRLLKAAGFKPGRPHTRANQYRLPIYGVEETARFLEMVRSHSR